MRAKKTKKNYAFVDREQHTPSYQAYSVIKHVSNNHEKVHHSDKDNVKDRQMSDSEKINSEYSGQWLRP